MIETIFDYISTVSIRIHFLVVSISLVGVVMLSLVAILKGVEDGKTPDELYREASPFIKSVVKIVILSVILAIFLP